MKLLPSSRCQEFAETLIAVVVAERCSIEGQKVLIQTSTAQQLIGVEFSSRFSLCCSIDFRFQDLRALCMIFNMGSHDLREFQPGVIDSLVDSLSFLSSLCRRVEVKLKEVRQRSVEVVTCSASSEEKVDSAVNSSSKDTIQGASENRSERTDGQSELRSPSKKVRLEVETDVDGRSRDTDAVSEETAPCRDSPTDCNQLIGGDPAASVDLLWIEKMDSVDEQKWLLGWTTSLVMVTDAIMKLVQR